MTNPIELEHFLEKAPFPASKQELIDYARQHEAKASVLVALETLPEQRYDSAARAAEAAWLEEEHEQGVAGGADSPDDA
jgi:hypothetical protein